MIQPRRRTPSGPRDGRVSRPCPTLLLLLLLAAGLAGCGGPGFPGYADEYPDEADAAQPGEPWTGPEVVVVRLASEERLVQLAGLPQSALGDVLGVGLQQVVRAAALPGAPESCRFDFTAADGYDLLAKRAQWALLPGWEELAWGVLYRHPSGDLRVTWDRQRQPWGSALSAYLIKAMDGGRITLLSDGEGT